MNRKRACVIGCGKIGALYDLEKSDLILTHAKGYYLSDKTELMHVIDKDKLAAKKVGNKYNCNYGTDYTNLDFNEIDILSICVPTEFHFEILEYLYRIGYKNLIILEKPVVNTDEEIKKINDFDSEFLGNIYINYIRSYDKQYRKVFLDIKNKKYSVVKLIQVSYFGEFEHNAVHALNLINNLFQLKPIVKYKDQHLVILDYAGVDVVFCQLMTEYANYDIVINTNTHKIIFDSLGYKLKIYESINSKKFTNINEINLEYEADVLNYYILNLIDIVFDKSEYKPTFYDGMEDQKLIKEIKRC